MKLRLIILTYLFLGSCVSAQTQMVSKDLKKDFGAKGDGISNDSQAWAEAVNFFSGKKNGKLIVPQGVYRIGEQTIDTNITNKIRFANLKYPANLRNVSDLEIVGVIDKKSGKPISILRFLDNQYYGYLNPANRMEALVANLDSEANLGAVLNLNHTCRNITIRNLELDGNFEKQIFHPIPQGVKKGADVGHYGITSYSVANLLLENLYVHHFALDGFYIQNDRKVLEDGKYHTIVKKCRSDLNGRQGLSFTVGSSILLIDSEFTNTGRGRVRISPAANVDIENHDASGASLKNIRIENCTMSNNLGGAGSINIAGKVEDIIITNSV
uniref:right-handed parallel beta-helix repeat-containing protein n=1 Tax=Pseudopedobacter sp. TaxID=1936787 RepID=UPI00333F419E